MKREEEKDGGKKSEVEKEGLLLEKIMAMVNTMPDDIIVSVRLEEVENGE